MQMVCKKIGFNDFLGGIAASGGTLSNLNALIAARNNAGLGSILILYYLLVKMLILLR